MTRELVIVRVRKAALFYLDGGDDELTIRAAADRYAVSQGAVSAAVKRIRGERGAGR